MNLLQKPYRKTFGTHLDSKIMLAIIDFKFKANFVNSIYIL